MGRKRPGDLRRSRDRIGHKQLRVSDVPEDMVGSVPDCVMTEDGALADSRIYLSHLSTQIDTGLTASHEDQDYEAMIASEKRARPPLTVTHYQCVGEGTRRVFYVWVEGQRRWAMPRYVIIPEQMSELLADEETSRRTTNDGVVAEIYAFDVDAQKYHWVRWDERVAKARYNEKVRNGMPDVDGIWS